MKRAKITVVGAGHVGGTTVQRLAEMEMGDVVLLDIEPGLPEGKMLDLTESAPLCHYDTHLVGTTRYEETAGSDVVVITSGVPRKPGMSRDDLLRVNVSIVRSVTEKIIQHSPNAVLLVVSNPLDAMTHVAYRVSGFPPARVIGMAGVLDSARFRAFIAMELNVSMESVQSCVLGGHGDSMVPLVRYTSVGGIPITELMSPERLAALIQRTREGGAEIVKLLKTGSAYYAPSAAAVEMVESIVKDKKKILPCAALCRGEYKIDGLFVGVPVKLGSGGVEQIIEIRLTPEEAIAFERSAAAVSALCLAVDKML
jgi:malate dehydrogenase